MGTRSILVITPYTYRQGIHLVMYTYKHIPLYSQWKSGWTQLLYSRQVLWAIHTFACYDKVCWWLRNNKDTMLEFWCRQCYWVPAGSVLVPLGEVKHLIGTDINSQCSLVVWGLNLSSKNLGTALPNLYQLHLYGHHLNPIHNSWD